MAVTVTVTSVKIDVTSTGGVTENLEALYQAVIAIDAAAMTKTENSGSPGSPASYTYTINVAGGQVYRELEISAGCSIEMDNPGDVLEMGYNNTTYSYIFDIVDGGEFIATAGGQTIDFKGDATHPRPYFNNAGRFEFKGTADNRSKIKNWSLWRDYTEGKLQTTWGTYQGWYLDYVDFEDTWYAASDLDFGYSSTGIPRHEFKNVTFSNPNSNSGGLSTFGYPFTSDIANYQDCVFENITIDGMGYGMYNSSGAAWKFKGSTIKNLVQEYPLMYKNGFMNAMPIKIDVGAAYNWDDVRYNQAWQYFENCSFLNNRVEVAVGSRYGIYSINYGAVIVFKNCTFGGLDAGSQIYRAFQIFGGSVVYLVGTTTIQHLTTSNEWVNTASSVIDGVELTITVKDVHGDPIEGAVVRIEQSEGKELHILRSDASGDVVNIFGDPIVVGRGKYTGTSLAGAYTDWSDSYASGRYHTIMITYPGYAPYDTYIEATTNQTINVTLTADASSALPDKPEFKFITHKKIQGAT